MNANIPDNLMDNVEIKLRKHVKNRKKKGYAYKAAAAILAIIVGIPVTTFAIDQYSGIPYKQEIDLARAHKNITEINQSFKYKNVEFKFKEIVADETGMEVIYDVSDPRYSINTISLSNHYGEKFNDKWGYSIPNSNSKENDKAFSITPNEDSLTYMKNNPITIGIENIIFDNSEDKGILDKVASILNPKNLVKVDWNIKLQVPMQEIRTIPVNKEYELDIGTLKINSIKLGVLKTLLDYSFIPKNQDNLSIVHPKISISCNNEYLSAINSSDNSPKISSMSIRTPGKSVSYDDSSSNDNSSMYGTQEFKSLYYNNCRNIGIKLTGLQLTYMEPKSYDIDINDLSKEYDYNGENFRISSMKKNNNSTEYTITYTNKKRIYNNLQFQFPGGTNDTYQNHSEKDLNTSTVYTKINTTSKALKLNVIGGEKSISYDEPEVPVSK